jgi:hypothetical protein
LKKLSNQLQSYREVQERAKKILELPMTADKDVRIHGHLISYVMFQCGDRVPGKSYRVRENGDRISNAVVEITIPIEIYRRLICKYNHDELLSLIIQDEMMFPYLEDSRPLSTLVSINRFG